MARVLITEDEHIVAEDIKAALLRYGHEVVGIACDGVETINLIEEKCPDVVLLDIMLPGDMNGIECAHYINDRFGIPVVFLTAYSDEKTMRQAFETSPFGFLIKPFQDKQLYATIEMAFYMSKELEDGF